MKRSKPPMRSGTTVLLVVAGLLIALSLADRGAAADMRGVVAPICSTTA